jgi:hypothetical protein
LIPGRSVRDLSSMDNEKTVHSPAELPGSNRITLMMNE